MKIGEEQKLIISRIRHKYNKASIKIESFNIDEDNVEAIGYMLIEALGVFLYDIRKLLPKKQKKVYNEYVQSLFEEFNKILLTKYEEAEE